MTTRYVIELPDWLPRIKGRCYVINREKWWGVTENPFDATVWDRRNTAVAALANSPDGMRFTGKVVEFGLVGAGG